VSGDRRRTVLVVDDSALGRRVIERTLSAAGFTVSTASDGAEGAVVALRERPAVVITDLEMPVMDGYQLVRLLKGDSATAGIPVLVVTTHDEAPSRFWGRRAGADAYLTKDYEPAELVEAVAALAARPRASLPASEPPPSGPLDVLARIASHLDRSLLRATLTNTLLERGVTASSFHEAAATVLRTLAEVVDAEVFGVVLADADVTAVHVLLPQPGGMATVETLRARLTAALPPPTISGVWRAPRPGEPLAALGAAGPQTDVVISGEVMPGLPPRPLRNLVTHALHLRDARGALAFEPRDRAQFAASSEELVEGLLGPLAVILDNARLAERLGELSMLDGLTRLLNHRAIYQRLAQELSRARRYAHPLAVVLCDFDHFKRINDDFGHLAGDAVLRACAAAMRPVLRGADVLGRYGGEEFLAVLPETNLAAAVAVAERLRQALADTLTVLPTADQVAMTGSFGVAELTELGEVATPQALVALADRRLYEAKEGGRNRVVPSPAGADER
jgi:two-component system cell cycle response regulator